MSTYEPADPQSLALLRQAVTLWHGELLEAGVTFGFYFAHGARDKDGQQTGPALKEHGVAVPVKTKISNHEARVAGHPDVRLYVDADSEGWEKCPDELKLGILDRGLCAIELKKDAEGNVKRDDQMRPMLQKVEPDYMHWGYQRVVERHHENSFEAIEVKHFKNKFGPCFEWAEGATVVAETTEAEAQEAEPGNLTISSGGESVTFKASDLDAIKHIGKKLRGRSEVNAMYDSPSAG